jgi:dipeptidyl aminopeptidase/acylaminoacyl peptidase
MTKPQVASYGSWNSPITTELIVSKTIRLGQIALNNEAIYWLEMRPSEAGRSVIVRQSPEGRQVDINPPPYNARTKVHEYGGGSFVVHEGAVYFSNFADQRLYRQKPGEAPQALTPPAKLRYANAIADPQRHQLICVCEDHSQPGHEATNSLVSLSLVDGSLLQVLASGNNFYASPCLNPEGNRLAWLTWNHPNMPWDGCELWVAELDEAGAVIRSERVAGSQEESIFQPQWSPDGVLYFIAEQTGWWNLYRWQGRAVEPVAPMEAEFGVPQWVFGLSTYAFESKDRLICAYTQAGIWYLASVDLVTGQLQPLKTPYTDIGYVSAAPGRAIFQAGSPTEFPAIVQLHLETGEIESLRQSSDLRLEPGYLSTPQALEFPTEGGQTAYGFFYPPANGDYTAPPGELPPLMVISHGGPTGATDSTLDLGIQYWTSRGIAVLDVNYGGSTGYGRAYRQRLDGQWGLVDVDDCINGARYLAQQGKVDGNRLMIRGGSAGGYTTLAALTFRDVFKAGTSYYGISDLEAMAKETHKFESRYLDRLIAPYPEQREVYVERSPIHSISQLECPVLVLQGLEDEVVPPNQAEMIVEALRTKGIPVAYLPFEGEQHGFRQAHNIKRALEAELYFYSKIFGFELARPVEPILIENL